MNLVFAAAKPYAKENETTLSLSDLDLERNSQLIFLAVEFLVYKAMLILTSIATGVCKYVKFSLSFMDNTL